MSDRAARIPCRLLLVLLLLLAPARARAQGWAWIDGFGYAASGVAAWSITMPDVDFHEDSKVFPVLALVTIGGAVLGARIGAAADASLARGDSLGGLHKAAVATGSVLAGAGVGAAVAGIGLAASNAGTFIGSDSETVAAATGAGAILGGAVTWWRRDALEPRSVTAEPTVTADGGVGIGVRVRF